MSLEVNVYVKEISDELIPKIVSRLNDFEMICEVDPTFSFSDQDGFLPFKFELTNPPFDVLNNKTLLSGFELYIEDFDFNQEKQRVVPKRNFFDKLFGREQPEVQLINNQIDEQLKECKKVITFIWHVGDSFEFRFASLTSVILTELTNGVCCYPGDDIWYENENIVNEAWKEIKEYENSLKEKELKYHEFESW